jgi:hypothetical protein
MKINRLRWLGHIEGWKIIGKKHTKVYTMKMEGKRPKGRQTKMER